MFIASEIVSTTSLASRSWRRSCRADSAALSLSPLRISSDNLLSSFSPADSSGLVDIESLLGLAAELPLFYHSYQRCGRLETITVLGLQHLQCGEDDVKAYEICQL